MRYLQVSKRWYVNEQTLEFVTYEHIVEDDEIDVPFFWWEYPSLTKNGKRECAYTFGVANWSIRFVRKEMDVIEFRWVDNKTSEQHSMMLKLEAFEHNKTGFKWSVDDEKQHSYLMSKYYAVNYSVIQGLDYRESTRVDYIRSEESAKLLNFGLLPHQYRMMFTDDKPFRERKRPIKLPSHYVFMFRNFGIILNDDLTFNSVATVIYATHTGYMLSVSKILYSVDSQVIKAQLMG